MKTPTSSDIASAERSARREFASPVDHRSQPAGLPAAGATRPVKEPDDIGLEQLVTALTRIPIPRRKAKAPKKAT
jgi:hypothetical protein